MPCEEDTHEDRSNNERLASSYSVDWIVRLYHAKKATVQRDIPMNWIKVHTQITPHAPEIPLMSKVVFPVKPSPA